MKKNTTELVFLLDRSGSMAGLEADTIGGFNGMIGKQQQEEGTCFVTTLLFDHVSETLHDRVRLENVPPMTAREYTVRGCTALLDALGGAIRHIEQIHKYARREDIPEHTLFVIITDGMENASRRYSSDAVKRMIEEKKQNNGWEFLFIGANIDAVETAAQYGIGADRAVDYHADTQGTEVAYEAVTAAVAHVRGGAPLQASWKQRVEQDYRARQKK